MTPFASRLLRFAAAALLGLAPAARAVQTTRLLPVALDVPTATAHFTTEVSLANRGSTPVNLTLLYTASLGSGSGTVTSGLAAGEQRTIPDILQYLRIQGLPIPAGTIANQQAGTLLVTFDGASAEDAVAVTARSNTATASPQPTGSAGLAYAGLKPIDGSQDPLTVYGLRANGTDRSNIAVFNTTGDSVTVTLTATSSPGGSTKVIDTITLPAYGWKQYSFGNATGFGSGWVRVERTGGAGRFSVYGVINDNQTNDGSFVLPAYDTFTYVMTIPVVVETPSFVSEVVLANAGTSPASFYMAYTEGKTPAAGLGGSMSLTLQPHEQRILPGFFDVLRVNGVNVGPKGGTYAGAVRIVVSGTGATVDNTFAGARTASPSPGGGQFGLFTPAVPSGFEAPTEAFLYGLRADGDNRTNVAVVHAGAGDADPMTLQVQAYDGDAGGAPRGTTTTVTLLPGQWHQLDGFLGSAGVRNGWVKVTRLTGTSRFITYAVVNDGGAPNQRTGDGAYVAMQPTFPAAEAFAGTWTGSWNNNTFGTTGPISLGISVDTAAQTVQATLTVGGNVFGLGAPPTQILTGRLSNSGAVFRSATALGTLTASWSPAGEINGTFSNIPITGFNDMTIIANATTSLISGSYTLHAFGSTIGGVFSLSKP